MHPWLLSALSAVFVWQTAACLRLTAGGDDDDDDDDDTSSDTASGSSGTGLSGTLVSGRGCGVDAATGVTLCLGVSVCPNQVFDRDEWPSCGFRVHSTGYDLQCVCGDMLCPIGTPLTCDQIQPLLSAQSQLSVCAAQAEGRCVLARGGVLGSVDETGCDRECAKFCGADTGCLGACGCTQ